MQGISPNNTSKSQTEPARSDKSGASQPPEEPVVSKQKVALVSTREEYSVSTGFSGAGLAEDDEEVVDQLLESLADEDFDLTAAEVGSILLPGNNTRVDEDKTVSHLQSTRREPTISEAVNDDNSDGKQMDQAVESILTEITEELKRLPLPSASATSENAQHGIDDQQPQIQSDQAGVEPSKSITKTADADVTFLDLPSVPSRLVDPVPSHEIAHHQQKEEDVDQDIALRLFSLKGIGYDAFGMPIAPTFDPLKHSQASKSSTKGTGLLRSKYSDEDLKTWCIVCLEDATIRCLGCNSDVYCDRCWGEMHVGPRASYDDRGHRWVKLGKMGEN